jgi:hypothetical protein
MRFMVILLGIFGGMVIVEQAFVPLRTSQLMAAGLNITIVGSILLFACRSIATACVYRLPAIAVWLYSIGGVIGLYAGITESFRALVTWGILANVLALICTFARREKREADIRSWEREQQITDLLTAVRAIQLAETPPTVLPVEWQPAAIAGSLATAPAERHPPARTASGAVGHAAAPLQREGPAIHVMNP